MAAALVASCGGKGESPAPGPTGSGSSAGSGSAAVVAPVAVDAAVVADNQKPAPPPEPVKPPPPPPPKGYDFIDNVKVLYRVAACGDLDKPLPDAITHGDADRAAKLTKVVDKHCKELAPQMEKYRKDYFGKAREWFVAHEPKDLSKQVVYAFGGGDLVSALVAFPDATEITTISLELAGDPRPINNLSPEDLARDLASFRKDLGLLIGVGSNLSTNLSESQRNQIAAQLSSHLLGMSTGGWEPVAARFFAIDDDGNLHYFEKDEIDADTKSGKSLSGSWANPAFAQSFYNVEVTYKQVGGSGETRTFRHIGWNLGDDYLKKHGGLLKHLEQKGKPALLVKGASYLLWRDDFAVFRKYLNDHIGWMISDSTGIAPNFLADGLEQEAYGNFGGPTTDHGLNSGGMSGDRACQKLWAHPKDKMPFRFGYLDKNGAANVMITKPKGT